MFRAALPYIKQGSVLVSANPPLPFAFKIHYRTI
jgi:hypothetical protein